MNRGAKEGVGAKQAAACTQQTEVGLTSNTKLKTTKKKKSTSPPCPSCLPAQLHVPPVDHDHSITFHNINTTPELSCKFAICT